MLHDADELGGAVVQGHVKVHFAAAAERVAHHVAVGEDEPGRVDDEARSARLLGKISAQQAERKHTLNACLAAVVGGGCAAHLRRYHDSRAGDRDIDKRWRNLGRRFSHRGRCERDPGPHADSLRLAVRAA